LNFQHELILMDVSRSDGLEHYVEEKVDKLATFTNRIHSSRVTIQAPSPHHKKGGRYQVSVELLLPGANLVANRDADAAQDHESMHVALRDAFSAMRRQLQNHLAKERKRTIPAAAMKTAEALLSETEALPPEEDEWTATTEDQLDVAS
jgi:ribosomal subunit interface protein